MTSTAIHRLRAVAAGVIASLAATTIAVGGTAGPAQFQVSVQISANCTIATNSPAIFSLGTYDPVTANASASSPLQVNTSSVLKVTCTAGANTPVIRLDQGSHPQSSSTAAAPLRRLSDGTHFLNYNLYKGGYTTVWGDTAATGLTYTGTGASDAITIYAQVDGDQSQPVGTYNDTIQANIDF